MTAAMVFTMAACGNKTDEKAIQETPEAESSEPEEAKAEAVPEAAAETEGMVVDAAMNSVSIQTPSGEIQFFAYPDEGVISEKADGILLGEVIKITYSGNVDEGSAVAQTISDGSIETTLPRETYEFALTAISCAKFNDLEGLSELVIYPVYIGIGDTSVTAKEKEGFLGIDRDALLPLGELADFNLFNMTESKAGIVIGDAKPNIIFTKTDDGFGITGINIE